MFFAKILCFNLAVMCVFKFQAVRGHGLVLDPPNRSSLWRFLSSFPKNYNDHQNFCGGLGIQWGVHQGKCGVCGDNWGDPVPRANENTGRFGLGYVVTQYKSGSVINVTSLLTVNHKGRITYSLCVIHNPRLPETEECFQNLFLENGAKDFEIIPGVTYVMNKVVLPKKLRCSRCVLRWNYKAGNSWGHCGNGTDAVGCGAQETFRSCSDISIV